MRYDGPSHRRGPHQGLREIVRTGSDLRPLLDHVGVDVRIRGAGTARGVERIMFSADHPYQSMADARAFLTQLPVSAADRERIAHGNAEKLFKL